MRMILVHGINQQGKSSQKILDAWLGQLHKTYAVHGPDPLARLSRIEAAYYGDTLEALSSVKVPDQAIALGVEATVDDFDDFAVEALEEIALRLGVTQAQIQAQDQLTVVPQGAGIHKKWVKAIARAIETVSPLRGTLALRVLGQAHAYIRNQHVHDEVNKLVRPLFEDDEPAIVVSHSLGTIVAYSLLREFARNDRPRQSSLLLTLGSPLGIDSVRKDSPSHGPGRTTCSVGSTVPTRKTLSRCGPSSPTTILARGSRTIPISTTAMTTPIRSSATSVTRALPGPSPRRFPEPAEVGKSRMGLRLLAMNSTTTH